jgi:hypothetical protein
MYRKGSDELTAARAQLDEDGTSHLETQLSVR